MSHVSMKTKNTYTLNNYDTSIREWGFGNPDAIDPDASPSGWFFGKLTPNLALVIQKFIVFTINCIENCVINPDGNFLKGQSLTILVLM